MIEKRQLERARRWCQKLTLAHFSVVLDVTQKAIMLNADGSKFADVPAKYQAAVVELLRSGESFTAIPIPPRQPARQYQASPSYQHLQRTGKGSPKSQMKQPGNFRLLVS